MSKAKADEYEGQKVALEDHIITLKVTYLVLLVEICSRLLYVLWLKHLNLAIILIWNFFKYNSVIYMHQYFHLSSLRIL